ncbi:glycosyltransferase [Quadrisphaera sp. DSM 44207]|uniref:glycosyltransferase n=1 Tax=Quadrisphaera sp. DSM 44207 TaxID=1881057 RepID=UPI00088DB704|nr:glycosyltransferase [Quadrisphaera sp. DSM 44207]SDQ04059.1 Glycosyltransferase involved in cell wall bisynthesis [Quadrisphaera sp. DSM 44207]
MRIAMVSEHASPLAVLGGVDAGGQNVHVAALAERLAARGHAVEVYTRRDDRRLPQRVPLAPGVEVVHVPAGPPRTLPKDDLLPWMPAFAAVLAQEWADPQRRPDVVHAHFWMSGVAALEAGRATGVPVLQTFHALGAVKRRHQGDYDTSPSERLAVEASLAREVDLVIATCSDEVAELSATGAGPRRVRVVPCGVDVEHFTPHGPALARTAPSRLVSVGRLVERKGVDTAVRALPVLPGTELVVVGGPPAAGLHRDPEALRLTALAADLGVADRVRLVGRVEHADLPAVYRSADVVVATPWYEPFGIVPLEAMACGRPLVGSAVGGLLDTVEEGRTGALVPPRDPAALAEAVQPLLEDRRRRERWGRAARARAVARYGWDRVAAETEAAYADVLTRQGRAVPARTPLDEPLEAL